MNYKHFIITRFNLKLSDNTWDRDRLGNSVLTDEWLAYRVDLFLKYCLPSVLNQTGKNFLWLLYFDSTTNEAVKKQFRELENNYKNTIKIILANGYDDFLKRYINDVLSLCESDHEFIITTRLDNDDIVHKDFIAKIQESFSEQEYMAINFVKILMLNPERKNKIHIDYSFSNHFITLIEKIKPSGISGCYFKGDRFWNKKNEIVQITDKPYCAEIISDRNLLNNFRGFPVFKTTDLSDFQLKGCSLKNSLTDPDNLKVYKMPWRRLFKYGILKLSTFIFK